CLESPVLWQDVGSGERSRAIPVEFVRCVLEVKSRATVQSVAEAAEKLSHLKYFASGENNQTEPYPRFLPYAFVWSVVYYELDSSETKKEKLFEPLIGLANEMRGFFPCLVLSGEGKGDDSGTLKVGYSEKMAADS